MLIRKLLSLRAATLAGVCAVLAGLAWLAWWYANQPAAAQQSADSAAQATSPSAASTPAVPSTPTNGPLRVKVVRPTVEPFRRVTRQPARVEPFEKIDVFAKASGYIGRLGPLLGPDGKPVVGADGRPRDLDLGDAVGKGQLLAELHVPEVAAELKLKQAAHAQAIVDVKKHQADIDYHAAELRRHEELVRGGGISADLLDVKRRQHSAALAAQASAAARVDVALREVELQQTLVGYAQVKAPFAGLITRRLVDNGAFVQSAATGKAEPLFSIARVDRLRIVADIPEADAKWIRPGQAAALTVESGDHGVLSGRIARASGVLDPQTHKLRVEVELAEVAQAASLRPGTFGWIEITLADDKQATFVPAGCLDRDGGKTYVWYVEATSAAAQAGIARRQEIKIGFYDAARAMLVGLEPGRQVILPGAAALRDGAAVDVAP